MKPTFIEFTSRRPYGNKGEKKQYALFECPLCNKIWEASYFNVQSGNTKSCGCWRGTKIVCKVDGCEDICINKKYQYCEKHYAMFLRKGHTEKHKFKDFLIHSKGYIKLKDKSHKLSDGDGYVYEHRKVLFDSNPNMICVHCGKEQSWETCHVDHLDDNKSNNELSNLAISCPVCNQKRGRHKLEAKINEKFAIHEYNGETLTLSDWGRKLGVSSQSMSLRLKKWTDRNRIFTEPRGKFGVKPTRDK